MPVIAALFSAGIDAPSSWQFSLVAGALIQLAKPLPIFPGTLAVPLGRRHAPLVVAALAGRVRGKSGLHRLVQAVAS